MQIAAPVAGMQKEPKQWLLPARQRPTTGSSAGRGTRRPAHVKHRRRRPSWRTAHRLSRLQRQGFAHFLGRFLREVRGAAWRCSTRRRPPAGSAATSTSSSAASSDASRAANRRYECRRFRSRHALTAMRRAAATCRGCELWKDATQTVFGDGLRRSRLMLVREMPGDREDLAGKPFVGPAGCLLDEALAAAEISRDDAYVTNVVKHFKWEPRGRRRRHRTPTTREVGACLPWLEAEIDLIRPGGARLPRRDGGARAHRPKLPHRHRPRPLREFRARATRLGDDPPLGDPARRARRPRTRDAPPRRGRLQGQGRPPAPLTSLADCCVSAAATRSRRLRQNSAGLPLRCGPATALQECGSNAGGDASSWCGGVAANWGGGRDRRTAAARRRPCRRDRNPPRACPLRCTVPAW